MREDSGISPTFDAALGRAVRRISVFDYRLAEVALFMVQGKGWQSHMESWYFAGSFGKYVGVSSRINLIHDVMVEFNARQTGEYQTPQWFQELEKDLRAVNSRRNRMAHDVWLGLGPENSPMLMPSEHPARSGRWDSGESVTEEDLKAFSDFVERVIEKLDAFMTRTDIVEWIGKSPSEN